MNNVRLEQREIIVISELNKYCKLRYSATRDHLLSAKTVL